MLDANKKITVSIDQLTDIMAESAVKITNTLDERDRDMSRLAIGLLAIYSAEVTQKLAKNYTIEEE